MLTCPLSSVICVSINRLDYVTSIICLPVSTYLSSRIGMCTCVLNKIEITHGCSHSFMVLFMLGSTQLVASRQTKSYVHIRATTKERHSHLELMLVEPTGLFRGFPKIGGPQYRPQQIIYALLIKGTTQNGTPNIGKPPAQQF